MKGKIQDRDGTFVTMDILGDDGTPGDGGYLRLHCGTIAVESEKAGFPPYLWYSMRTNGNIRCVDSNEQLVLGEMYQNLLKEMP